MPVNTTVGTAARFGLTVAGGYFFGPAGAAAGALVGSFLFGGGGPDIEGPRLGDLSVSGATYGGVRPVGYGVHKVAGTMIWARDIIEVKSTRKEGGSLFGGGQKITEYRYYGSFAVALAEGPAAGVIRVWANDKLIANYAAPDFTADPLSAEEVMKYYGANSRFNIRVYLGGNDQEPDRIIREHVEEATGEANITPAFRGTVYLVFDRIPLDEFNNQIPAITAEVAWAGQDEIQDRAITFGGGPVTGSVSTSHYAVDWQRGYAIFNSSTGIRRVRLLDGVEDLSALFSVINVGHVIDPTDDGKALQAVLVDPEGFVYAIDGDVNYGAVAKIDPDTLHVLARAEDGLSFMSVNALVNVYNLAERDGFLVAGGVLDDFRVWRTSTMTQVFTGALPGTIHAMIAGFEGQGESDAWLACNSGGAILLRRLTLAFGAAKVMGNPTGVVSQDFTVAAAALGGTTSLSISGAMAYEATLDALVIRAILDGSTQLLFAWSVEDGVLWQIAGVPSGLAVPRNLRITRGRFATQVTTSSGNLHVFDTIEGIETRVETGYRAGIGGAPQYDPLTHQLIRGQQSGFFQAWPERASRLTVSLRSVVTSLCARVGIPSADIDVAELTDQVKGMALGRQMPVRGALELLAVTYNFDCAESDHQLVFKKRGRDPVRAITEDDLVAERQEIIVEERAQDVDLPLRVSLNYQDHDRDAEPATQTAQRIKNPNPTMYSDNSQSIELPMTLTAQEAREIVVRQCFAPWAERTKLAFALSQEHLDLDPGDVVTLLLDSGRQLNLRAVVMGIGRDLSIRLEAVTESSSSYDVSSVQASGGLNYRSVIAAPTSASRLILVDSPLLADSHDAGRAASGVYWFMGGIGQPGWQGALLFESVDGALYTLVGEGLEEASWGTLTSALDPPSTTGLYAIDTVNAVQIRPVTFIPSEVTELEMLNGANRMLIVDASNIEVVAFQNVSDDGDGYYTLAGLMRALRGTEAGAEAGHAAGALCVLLPSDPDSMERARFALAALDTPRYYKAPGRGATLADACRRAITPVGRDLMPYRPVQLTSDGAAWGSDIVLSWVRQTRVGGHGWPDGITEDVALAEDSEAYELEVLDGPGGAIVRTATGLTSPSFTYTTAMQSADFVGAQTGLNFRVYQVSAQVGRGFASAERTGDT